MLYYYYYQQLTPTLLFMYLFIFFLSMPFFLNPISWSILNNSSFKCGKRKHIDLQRQCKQNHCLQLLDWHQQGSPQTKTTSTTSLRQANLRTSDLHMCSEAADHKRRHRRKKQGKAAIILWPQRAVSHSLMSNVFQALHSSDEARCED